MGESLGPPNAHELARHALLNLAADASTPALLRGMCMRAAQKATSKLEALANSGQRADGRHVADRFYNRRRWARGKDMSRKALRSRLLDLQSDWVSLSRFEPDDHPEAIDMADVLRALLIADPPALALLAIEARKSVGMVPMREKRTQSLDALRRIMHWRGSDARKEARDLVLLVLTHLPPDVRAEIAADAPQLAELHARRFDDFAAIQPWIDRVAEAIDWTDGPRKKIRDALVALGCPKDVARNLYNFEQQRAKQRKKARRKPSS